RLSWWNMVLAFTAEPVVMLFRWLGQRIPVLGRMGDQMAQFSSRVGLREDGVRGPLGLILVSFAISPGTGRAAAASAGHGFIPGWTLAIIGDMAYFGLLMVSTLWLSDRLGDERMTVTLVLGATWLLPLLLRWWRRRQGLN